MIHSTALSLAADCNPRSKAALLTLLTGQWNLRLAATENYLSPVMAGYYIQRLNGVKLRNRIYDGVVRSLSDDKDYAVIYHQCRPEQCFKSDVCSLSFRSSTLGNFVLVRPMAPILDINGGPSWL